jgi:hypothetical protein
MLAWASKYASRVSLVPAASCSATSAGPTASLSPSFTIASEPKKDDVRDKIRNKTPKRGEIFLVCHSLTLDLAATSHRKVIVEQTKEHTLSWFEVGPKACMKKGNSSDTDIVLFVTSFKFT